MLQFLPKLRFLPISQKASNAGSVADFCVIAYYDIIPNGDVFAYFYVGAYNYACASL